MKKRYWLLLLVLIPILIVVFGLLVPAGFFKSIHPHFDGKQVVIYTAAYGTEDLAVDRTNGLLFISSTNRRIKEPDTALGNGLYLLDLDKEDAQPYLLNTDFPDELFLHGISLFRENSSTYIYAVNHRKDGDYIELFKYSNDSLLIQNSFSDPLMVSPNDVVGVSTSEFYITNDHTSKDGSQDTKEDFLRFNNRNLVHYKDGKYTEAASGLAMPNGINVSNDGKLLYTTTTLGQEFITYDRDTNTGELKEISRQDLGSGLDNIDIDTDGNIWIGSHPKMLTFLGHAGDVNNLSPSQVFKLSPKSNIGEYQVEEVYLDDGTTISASSVAVRYKDDLLIGAVFDKKVYRGRMN